MGKTVKESFAIFQLLINIFQYSNTKISNYPNDRWLVEEYAISSG